MEVWVFSGVGSSGFPAGVFSSIAAAETWIELHSLSGTLTLYRVDVGAYDWAVEHGYFKPTKPHHETPEFVGRFSGGDQHYHYEGGARTA